MQVNRTKLFLIAILCIVFNGRLALSQTSNVQPPSSSTPASELSIEEELNQVEQPAAPATTSELTTPSNIVEPTTNELVTEAPQDTNEYAVDEDIYAMNGWSFGAAAFIQNYNVDALMYIDNNTDEGLKVDLSSKSADFQNVGVVARYAILPLNKIGTDINFTLGNSINHDSFNFSSITTLRGEINLGYAIEFAKQNSIYFLAGLGYEAVYGQDINRLVVPGGGMFQIGSGITFNKKISVEAFYSYATHTVAGRYLDDAANSTPIKTSFQDSANRVISNIIQGRLVYAF
ncbi:MAG: hypothetical protein ABL930_05610 [Pseudobdellovibrio sp.]